jgi:hypothetical protein
MIALWAIMSAPALCTAGVLAHACPCDDGNAEACDHEADCDMDPCSEQALRKDETQNGLAPDAGYDVLANCPVTLGVVSLVKRQDPNGPTSCHPAPPLGVPHASDLPLLN